MGDIEFLILLLGAAAVLVRLADQISIPYPIVLVVGGLAIGLIPSLPDLHLDPDVVFLVFLPPLLVSAGYYASPRELKAELRPLALLAIGLVLVTMAAVAVVAHAIVPGMSWEAAFVLGAIVGPTDPVSATATFSRIGAPARLRLLVEGEAMVNDGTALVAYRVALAAAVEGTFSLGDAVFEFLYSAAGGVAIGVAIAWLALQIIRRQTDVALSIFVTVIQAYAAYIVAEEIGVSGVLSAVACGIYGGWNSHLLFDAGTRLTAVAFWSVLTFGLEALLFVLLGLQAPTLADELDVGSLAGAGARRGARRDRRAHGVHADPGRRLRRHAAGADRGRLVGDARSDLARRRAGGADDRGGAARDPPADVRRDRRDAARSGAHAPAAVAGARAARPQPLGARRGAGAAGDRAGRAGPARRAGGGGRERPSRCGGCASSTASASRSASRRSAVRSCPRTDAGSCTSTARCGAS